MELLHQKGADLLAGPVRGAADVPGTQATAGVSGEGRKVWSLMERIALGIAVGVTLVGIYLFFRELSLTGLTWDEWMDYQIARDYYFKGTYLTNLDDPSQARLSHLLATSSFKLLGESYLSFKLPFVVTGLLGGLALFMYLRTSVSFVAAAVTAAMYFTCPYVLAASRTGATAGDVLVLVTTLGFIITLHRWIQTNRFWPYGLGTGLCCGLAIGSKWTGAVLLGCVGLAWLFHLIRQKRGLFVGSVWTGMLAQQWVAVAVAFMACPTLLLGVDFIQQSLAHSLKFTGMAVWQFGEMRAVSPWYYIPAVLFCKISLIQLTVFVVEIGALILHVSLRKRRMAMQQIICVLALLPMIPLALKGFQNAHYYVAMVPAVMVLSAVAFDRWLRAARGTIRPVVLGLGVLAMVTQLSTAIRLAPDYLMAGRQFGRFYYSQFAGPVVNHCQGLPFAIREVNRLITEEHGPRLVHIPRSCLGVMAHAIEHGPVKALTPITPYPPTPVRAEHLIVIPSSYDYDNIGAGEAMAFGKWKDSIEEGCHQVGKWHPDFEIWYCPAR